MKMCIAVKHMKAMEGRKLSSPPTTNIDINNSIDSSDLEMS